MARTRVLFIDDDESLQLLAVAMMNSGLFEVFSAKRTSEAEQVLARQIVDVIILDVMLPEEDGIHYAKRLRAGGNRTPLLMLSAVSDPVVIRQALSAGATDYLVKPFDIHALQKKLLTILGKEPASFDAKKSSGLFGWRKK